MKYVDGFVVPVPKNKLDAYRRIARTAGKVWKEHGALEYVECVAEDWTGTGATFTIAPFSGYTTTLWCRDEAATVWARRSAISLCRQ